MKHKPDTWLQAMMRSRIREGKLKGRKRTPHRFPRIRWMYPWAQERRYAKAIQEYLDRLKAALLQEIKANWASWVPAQRVRRDSAHTDAHLDATWSEIRKTVQKQKVALFEGGMAKAINITGKDINTMNALQWQKFVSSIGGSEFYAPEDFSLKIAAWEDLNENLLESLGEELIKKVNIQVSNGIMAGKQWDEVADSLEAAGLPPSRASFIARDQTGKLNGTLAQARQEDAGIDEYEWDTSMDERVRDTHASLQGKICRWDDPTVYKESDEDEWQPRDSNMYSEGHPGDDYNCRCVALPHITQLWKQVEDEEYAEAA